MEQKSGIFLKANSHSSSQEIPRPFMEPKG